MCFLEVTGDSLNKEFQNFGCWACITSCLLTRGPSDYIWLFSEYLCLCSKEVKLRDTLLKLLTT